MRVVELRIERILQNNVDAQLCQPQQQLLAFSKHSLKTKLRFKAKRGKRTSKLKTKN